MTHNDYRTFQRKLGAIIEYAYEEGARIEEEETNKLKEFKELKYWLVYKRTDLSFWARQHEAEHHVMEEMREDFKKVFETIDLALKEN